MAVDQDVRVLLALVRRLMAANDQANAALTTAQEHINTLSALVEAQRAQLAALEERLQTLEMVDRRLEDMALDLLLLRKAATES